MKLFGKTGMFVCGVLFGTAGLRLLPPETSALLHNVSTIAISLKDRTRLLPPEE